MSPVELPKHDAPEVSVIVLGFRRADVLGRCLESLARHESSHPFEVVVVLNDAAPSVRAFVEQEVTGAVVVDLPVNAGFAGGCNRGADVARGRILALLNDDVEVAPRWIDALVDALDSRPKAGLVGSLLLFPDGRVQDAGGTFEADGMPHAEGRGCEVDDLIATTPRLLGYATACGAAVRRDVWHEVEGMDEGYYPAYFEDVDLCLRLRAAGWEVWLVPDAVVVHEESASSDFHQKLAAWRPNRERFLARWGPGSPPGQVVRPDPRRDLDDPAVQASLLRRLAALADEHVEALRGDLASAQKDLAGTHEALDHERAHGAWLLEVLDEERARAASAEAQLAGRWHARLRRWARRVLRPSSPPTPTPTHQPSSGAAP